MASTLPPGELFALETLVTATAQGIASRVLARTAAGNITLFAFDAGEELSEHTAPFDALVITLSGALVLTIGGRDVQTTPQSVVLMPANVPHAGEELSEHTAPFDALCNYVFRRAHADHRRSRRANRATHRGADARECASRGSGTRSVTHAPDHAA